MKILVSLLFLSLCLPVYGMTIDQLKNQGNIEVSYTVEPAENIIQYQPVTLEIEIATDRWFARGSQVERFEIDGAVVYHRGISSTNSSRSEGNKTWAVQLWTLVVYPQDSGSLKIPSIDVFVSINVEDSVAVEGTISLDPRMIEVVVPKEMEGLSPWLATSKLTVEENFEGLKEKYQAGDAITHTIITKIEGAPAMLLPRLDTPRIEGLAIYAMQPTVEDYSNRGELVGTRIQQFVYTIERPGRYSLPAQTFYWWNLDSSERQNIEIEALNIVTEDFSIGEAVSTIKNINAYLMDWKTFAIGLFVLTSIALLLRWLLRTGFRKRFKSYQYKKYRGQAFLLAIEQENSALALQHLYEILQGMPDCQGIVTLDAFLQKDEQCFRLLFQLKQVAFAEGNYSPLTINESQLLLDYLNQRASIIWPWQQPINLCLNS